MKRYSTLARLSAATMALHSMGCIEVSLRTGRSRGGGCFSMEDCAGDWVCFMGACQPPGRNLSEVYIDVLPPNDSDYLPHQERESPRDLGDGLRFDVTLRAPKTLHGWVDGSPLADEVGQQTGQRQLAGVLAARIVQPRAETVMLPSTRTDLRARVSKPGGTFTVRFVPGNTYDLTFTPDVGEDDPPRPPVTYSGYELDGETQLSLQYPGDENLVRVPGRLLAVEDPPSPVMGAEVRGASGGSDGPPLVSTTETTGPEGRFELVFPPGTQAIDLEVRPGANPTLPHMTFPNLGSRGSAGGLGDIVLNIPIESVTIEGVVHDGTGAGVPEAVISFEGLVGTAETKGLFAPTVRTNAAGTFEVALLPGRYDVTVVPLPSRPQAVRASEVCVPDPDPAQPSRVDCGTAEPVEELLELVVTDKIAVSGQVVDADGRPVADARVTFLSRGGVARREFLATTDGDGAYEVAVDAGTTAAPTIYEVTVEPPNTSGQPRHRELLQLGPDPERKDLRLFPPSFVSGRVLEPGGTPLPGVILALYSRDLAAVDEGPLLVGLGQAGSGGEFVIALPTPP